MKQQKSLPARARSAVRSTVWSLLLGAALSLLVSHGASAQADAVAARFPAGSIQSVEQADRALAEAEQGRAAVETRYIADQNDCYPRFFATACLDEAKERRRAGLVHLRSIEQEANAFKRRARVAERDAALRERESAAAAREPIAPPVGVSPAPEKAVAGDVETEASRPESAAATRGTDRARRHTAKVSRTPQQAAEEARKRAENVAAYQRKVQEAQARQREVEVRKQEKARERDAHAASQQGAPD